MADDARDLQPRRSSWPLLGRARIEDNFLAVDSEGIWLWRNFGPGIFCSSFDSQLIESSV